MLALANKIISNTEMQNRQGEFFNFAYYHYLVDQDCDIFTEEGTLLFSFRKKVIPDIINDIVKSSFLAAAKKSKTNSRGVASGKVDISQLSKGSVVDILHTDKFQTQIKFANGNVSKYRVCNIVKSMIAGYYNKPKRGQKIANGSFRLTAFCEKYPEKWNNAQQYVRYIDSLYAMLLPQNYEARKQDISRLSPGVIDNTIFTTLTINYNFRTAAHTDKGNLAGGLSILTTHGHWNGCYLGYPQYGICINVEEGDLLIMNPHEYHCNTEFLNDNYERLSIVTYTRNFT